MGLVSLSINASNIARVPTVLSSVLQTSDLNSLEARVTFSQQVAVGIMCGSLRIFDLMIIVSRSAISRDVSTIQKRTACSLLFL